MDYDVSRDDDYDAPWNDYGNYMRWRLWCAMKWLHELHEMMIMMCLEMTCELHEMMIMMCHEMTTGTTWDDDYDAPWNDMRTTWDDDYDVPWNDYGN
jgi:hypothetical protein